MINTASDFSEAASFLQEQRDDFPKEPGEQMDSDDYNTSMKAIGDHLNTLYEKIRVVEDMKDYCRTFVVQKMNEKRKAFQEKLSIINNLSDQYRDKDYIAYNVPFVDSTAKIYDRDGTKVDKFFIKNGKLEQGRVKTTVAPISMITHESEYVCYSNSYDQIRDGYAGRSYYITYEPIFDGLKEKVRVTFSKTVPVNAIDIDASNCDIRNIRLVNEGGQEVPVTNINSTFETVRATALVFDAVCTRYAYEIVDMQKDDPTDTLLPARRSIAQKGTLRDRERRQEKKQNETAKDDFNRSAKNWKDGAEAQNQKNVEVEEAN